MHRRFVHVFWSMALLGLVMTGCGTAPSPTKPMGPGFLVVASIPPLAALIGPILGEAGQVEVLMETGVSPHFFELTAGQMQLIEHVDIVFVCGSEVDIWATRAAGAKAHVVFRADPHSHAHDESGEHSHHLHEDRHDWVDPKRFRTAIPVVVAELARLFPAQADAFQARAAELDRAIVDADQRASTSLAALADRAVLQHHPAFEFFLAHYGISNAGAIEQFAGDDPSPAVIRGHLEQADAISVLIVEPQLNPRAARVIAEEIGVPVVVLDPLGAGVDGRSYPEWLVDTAERLAAAAA